jgi:hypothetical protein
MTAVSGRISPDFDYPQQPLPMSALFPMDILNAIGGPGWMESLPKINFSPDYAPNIVNLPACKALKEAIGQPEIHRGEDQQGRPFLILFLPAYQPIVYHTHSDCAPADFTDFNRWEVSYKQNAVCKSLDQLGLNLLSDVIAHQDWQRAVSAFYQGALA